MAVQFILGRAGTGKTHRCVTEIADALKRNPIGDDNNGELLWIVPAQATFMAERLLVAHSELGGIIRARVLSFRRLTLECARALNLGQTQEADDLARTVLLEDLVLQNRDKLELFNVVADRPGFLQKLDGMLRELMQAGHTGPTLRHVADREGTDPVLNRKLHDLGNLLDTWDEALYQRGMVSDRLPQIIAPRLGEVQFLNRARIWVDAFSALTRAEEDLLVALAKRVDQVTLTLLADPDAHSVHDPKTEPGDCDLFRRTEKLYRRLRDAFTRARVPILKDIALRDNHRNGNVLPLAAIEKELFCDKPKKINNNQNAVEIWRCQNPEVEVRACAQKIREYVTKGMRYRDIGLIIADLEGYAEPVRRIFQQHAIPHFVDLRRSITHHPLVEFLRMAGAMMAGGITAESLLLMLKTGLTPVQDADVHLVENYMLAHGITRINPGEQFTYVRPNVSEDDPAQPVSAAEKQMLARTNAVMTLLKNPLKNLTQSAETENGDVLARRLYEFIIALKVDEKIIALTAEESAAEDTQMHRQAWAQCISLIETLERVTHNRAITPVFFTRLLSASLETLSAGLIPPALDQVLVSSVARSRHPELKVTFVLGALEAQMPPVRPEDPMLTDVQRAAVNQHSDLKVEPGSDEQLIESRFFDYVAFTRSGETMIVSYPSADMQEKPVAPSGYVPRLIALLNVTPKEINSGNLYDPQHLATIDDALISAITRETTDDTAINRDNLLNWLLNDANTAQAYRDVKLAGEEADAPALSDKIARQIYGQSLQMSVSQLETYGACPLQYFFKYTLGLKARKKFELDAMSLGTLYHAVLQKVFNHIIAGKMAWPECTSEELTTTLRQAVAEATDELQSEMARSMPQYARLQERTVRALGLVLEAQRRAACAGNLRPVATEVVFGGDTKRDDGRGPFSLNQYQVRTPQNHTVTLNGKIDRVDVEKNGKAAIVVDYKSGEEKKLELQQVFFGISLQLPVYLLVLEQTELEPIGSFFVPLKMRRISKPGDIAEPGTDPFYQQFKIRGALDASTISKLDRDAQDSSAWYPYDRKKDGTIRAGSDALEHQDFAALLHFTENKIAQMADDLAQGHIAPAPYQKGTETPCDHCEFSSACPFDRMTGTYRQLPKTKRDDVLAAMSKALADKERAS